MKSSELLRHLNRQYEYEKKRGRTIANWDINLIYMLEDIIPHIERLADIDWALDNGYDIARMYEFQFDSVSVDEIKKLKE